MKSASNVLDPFRFWAWCEIYIKFRFVSEIVFELSHINDKTMAIISRYLVTHIKTKLWP